MERLVSDNRFASPIIAMLLHDFWPQDLMEASHSPFHTIAKTCSFEC